MRSRPSVAEVVGACERLGIALRRSGGEWSGPCPRCGGRDRFYVREGRRLRGALIGCRGCLADRGADPAPVFRALGLGGSSSPAGGGLRMFDLAGLGPLWGPDAANGHRDTRAVLLELGDALLRRAEAVRPRLIVLDPAAGTYGGNENDRAAVRAFLSWLGDAAARTGAAVLLGAHPPKSGDATAGANGGASYSGSTDWRNAARALWTLEPATVPGWEWTPEGGGKARPATASRLRLGKSNYGPEGATAWLALRRERDIVRWDETTAPDAARDYHERRGRPAPGRKGE